MRMKNTLRIVITTFILLGVFFVSLYLTGINSEPYPVAVDYIFHEEKITNALGPLMDYHLAFWGYSARYNGPHGEAEYKILVKGKKQQANVYVQMEKNVGIWKIVEANMILVNGKSISLK